MKPSERLKEIIGQETYNDKQLGRVVEAIIFYLDELHEQQKPKHECTIIHCAPKCMNLNSVDDVNITNAITPGIVREL